MVTVPSTGRPTARLEPEPTISIGRRSLGAAGDYELKLPVGAGALQIAQSRPPQAAWSGGRALGFALERALSGNTLPAVQQPLGVEHALYPHLDGKVGVARTALPSGRASRCRRRARR